MLENEHVGGGEGIGASGHALARNRLPPMNTSRWVARRKALVVAAVEDGLLTSDQACRRYSLSAEELASWQRSYERSGTPGLRVTKIKHYREQRQIKQCKQEYFSAEAEACRRHAAECSGRSEERLLLSLARALEELASEQECAFPTTEAGADRRLCA